MFSQIMYQMACSELHVGFLEIDLHIQVKFS